MISRLIHLYQVKKFYLQMSFKKNKSGNTNYHSVTNIEEIINSLYKKINNTESDFFVELKKKWSIIIGIEDSKKYHLLKIKALKVDNQIKYNLELNVHSREYYNDFIFYKANLISKINLYFGREIVKNIKVSYKI